MSRPAARDVEQGSPRRLKLSESTFFAIMARYWGKGGGLVREGGGEPARERTVRTAPTIFT